MCSIKEKLVQQFYMFSQRTVFCVYCRGFSWILTLSQKATFYFCFKQCFFGENSLTFGLFVSLTIKSVHCANNKMSSHYFSCKIFTIFFYAKLSKYFFSFVRVCCDIYAWVCQNSEHLYHWFGENVIGSAERISKPEPTLKYFWIFMYCFMY